MPLRDGVSRIFSVYLKCFVDFYFLPWETPLGIIVVWSYSLVTPGVILRYYDWRLSSYKPPGAETPLIDTCYSIGHSVETNLRLTASLRVLVSSSFWWIIRRRCKNSLVSYSHFVFNSRSVIYNATGKSVVLNSFHSKGCLQDFEETEKNTNLSRPYRPREASLKCVSTQSDCLYYESSYYTLT